ncbi:MAG: PIG-L family deacetylase, partial [Chloroflexales bacterium]
MLFHSLADIVPGYDHVYLSPHLDDAALCCGGAIAGQRAVGQRVLVVNICTAAPRPDAAFSDLARAFHREWGLSPEEAVAARLREDATALTTLDADRLHVGALDAIYRHPTAYDRRETLFGVPDDGDPLLPAMRALIAQLRDQRTHSG